MQVTSANDVKIYNLSAGKSLPEWLEEREKARRAGKSGGDRRNVQLLQDLEMPDVSTSVEISSDGQYVAAVGTYKPRVRCYEVAQLGLKFERCLDEEVVAFRMLSDDYTKMIFLQERRYVELHSQSGRYFRLRIPRPGRDLAYNPVNCEVYFVGDGPKISRLNLEQGRLLQEFETQSLGSNACVVNPEHHLLAVGTVDGAVEAWDYRSRQRVARLDCLQAIDLSEVDGMPEVTALRFKDALTLAVGTSSGHVQLFDIRSARPTLVKDHMYGLPVKKILFHTTYDQVMSLDAKALKIWDRLTGKPYAAIESEHKLNDVASYPSSGLLFMANEQPKIQAHFLPSLGPAPSWCSFLDSLTEEMEENDVTEVYDDYKFVTKERLVDLGLDHLVGTSLLRAYMHGYFMDIRLYRKAEALSSSQSTKMTESKIRRKLEEERKSRVALNKALPTVNKDLFLKLKEMETKTKKKNGAAETALLKDDRFQDMFKDERFAIDTSEEAYQLLNPVLSKLDDSRLKKLEQQFQEASSDDDESVDDIDSDLSDGDDKDTSSEEEEEEEPVKKRQSRSNVKLYEMKDDFALGRLRKKSDKLSIGARLAKEDTSEHSRTFQDGRQMTFARKESSAQMKMRLKNKEHRAERTKLKRSAQTLSHRNKPSL